MKEVVIINLKFVPYQAKFRYDKTWWYHIPPADGPENAIEAESNSIVNIRLEKVPNDTKVAAYSFEIPMAHLRYGRRIWLNDKKDK